MKKIIALFVMFFAFTVSMNAQTEEAKTAAEKDLKQFNEVVTVNKDTQQALYYLFIKKHEAFIQQDLSDERKTEVSKVIEAKLRATLDSDNIAKLEKNKDLFNQLIGAPVKEKR